MTYRMEDLRERRVQCRVGRCCCRDLMFYEASADITLLGGCCWLDCSLSGGLRVQCLFGYELVEPGVANCGGVGGYEHSSNVM